MKEIKNELLNEKYYEIDHASGLKILVMPQAQAQTNYALFGTAFGSADNRFVFEGKQTNLPDGTAHFLEHKLFESEGRDAFELFAQTGARANAYTSFDRTCYLFSCSCDFYENLRSLLSFVSQPYFTEETIAKEQGIIAQEIKMYRDSPEWQASVGLLGALYHRCAVNTDIAGSVESIAQITPAHLYTAYHAFYRPENMILSICGNVEVRKIVAICDELIKPAEGETGSIAPANEPETVVCKTVLKKMPVSMPVFAFGYKEKHEAPKSLRERSETVLLNQILIGTMSPLYQALLEEELIGEDFSSEYFTSRQNSCVIFSGTGKNAAQIKERFEAEVQRVLKEGIDKELFDCVIRDMYGTIIRSFNAAEDIATDMYECYASGFGYFDEFELFHQITLDDLQKRLKEKYNVSRSAISVIEPLE